MRPAKYTKLFEDADVKRWYDNIARGSIVTADVYLRRLGNFSTANKLTPKKLAAMTEDELPNLLMDNITRMEKKYAGSYVHSTVKAIKSWLSHNRRELKVKMKIKGAQETPTLKDERVPTKEELTKIFLAADPKARAAAVLVSQSGLRIETVGDYKGEDGLRVKDLPEMAIKDGKVEFKKVPTIIIIRPLLSKARHQYFTFLTEEGCGYLRDYLEERIRSGEKITADSPIVTPKQRMKPFIRSINVGDTIRVPMRKAGFSWRPYVLRSYFDTQLMLAESKGLVLRDYRQFWMGHKGDIENRYTTNKHRLTEAVIVDMREAFRRSQDYLQTTKPETPMSDMVREFKKQLLIAAGYRDDEIAKMDLAAMTNEEMQQKVKERLLGAMVGNGQRQRIVPTAELERHLAEGWEFVASPPGLEGRLIIRLPE